MSALELVCVIEKRTFLYCVSRLSVVFSERSLVFLLAVSVSFAACYTSNSLEINLLKLESNNHSLACQCEEVSGSGRRQTSFLMRFQVA